MRIPESLSSLVDSGIIEAVLRPLMSGKEAQIYLLRSGGELRVAKVYKAAQDRSFRQRAEYTEGRTVRNTRDQRAMSKRTRHGREQDEIAWRATEVDMIYRLHAAGVRVPTPYHFIDGVFIMELIVDSDGDPASRLGDVELDRESALVIYDQLLRYVVQMLCADVVHGDLSDFNVLLAPEGPVIIDFPQAVNAAGNQNARKLLVRDVDNLHRFLARYVPEKKALPYAEEMWQLYQRGELTPDVRLTGRYRAAEHKVDTGLVLDLIADAERDERRRRSSLGLSMRGASAAESTRTPERQPDTPRGQPSRGGQEQRRPDARQGQPARAQNPVEQRQPQRDSRQPARTPNGVEQHRRPPQPARAAHPNQGRPPQRDSRQAVRAPTIVEHQRRQPIPARGQAPVEQRAPQRDSRAANPAQHQRAPERDSRQGQPSRAVEHRPPQRDSRTANGVEHQRAPERDSRQGQPSRGVEHRAPQRDSRAPTVVEHERAPERDSRQGQPSRGVEHRPPQRDSRAANVVAHERAPQRDARAPQRDGRQGQPSHAQNPVELRAPQRDSRAANVADHERAPQRDSRQGQASRADGVGEPSHRGARQPARAANVVEQPRSKSDSRQPQPSHGQNLGQNRAQTPPIDPPRTTTTSPLPAAGPRRSQSHGD
jgi:RIO kinase 1